MSPGLRSGEALLTAAPLLEGAVRAGQEAGVVALLWRFGEQAEVISVGVRDATGAPMARDTIFRIASMTKPVTSAAVMMLVDEGKLALDDPVGIWLPELGELRVLGSANAALDDATPAKRQVTIEDLLTHRAGFTYGFMGHGALSQAVADRLGGEFPSLPRDEWLGRLGELPLVDQPGAAFHYGLSTDVLGALIERVSGETLPCFLRRRFFDPLGMIDTDFWCPPERRHRLADILTVGKDGGLRATSSPVPEVLPAFCSGGAGLYSTADDYLAFARMLLEGGVACGRRLLSEAAVRAMTRDRLTVGQRAQPFLGFPFWRGQGFGLGVSVVTDPAKHAWMGAGSLGAFGWPGAFGTWWQADPIQHAVLIYLVQHPMEFGPRLMGRDAVLPAFQRQVHAAFAEPVSSSALVREEGDVLGL